MDGPEQVEKNRLLIGWREWLALPELGIPAIKAKVDTGARTSALHAFHTETFRRAGKEYVRFSVHPLQHHDDLVVKAEARLLDKRQVRDSGGHQEKRYVIETLLRLGVREWPVEITLTDRDSMLFRMLLGRTAMAGALTVVPDASYLQGEKPKLQKMYPAMLTAHKGRENKS